MSAVTRPNSRVFAFALALVLAVLGAGSAAAADAPPVARVALRGAEVHPASGAPIQNGVVLVENGKIAAAGPASLAIPSGFEVVDLPPGAVVTPAFVDAHSHLGVYRETDETSSAIAPEVRAKDAYDPSDRLLDRVARAGIGTVLISPQDGNVVGGRAAALKPYRGLDGGADPRGRFLGSEPMKLSLGAGAIRGDREPTSRPGLARLLGLALAASLAKPAEPAPSARLHGSLEAERRKLLAELARGERSALASARTLEDAEIALALARAHPLRIRLVGALGARDAATALAAAKIGVVLPPLQPSFTREELRAAAEFHGQGVALAFSTSAPLSDPASLRFSAALAVRSGLPEAAALRALTLGGAEAAGVEKTTGSLEAGKDGDVAVWDGPPLSLSSRLLRLYVDGRLIHSLATPPAKPADGAATPAETL